MRLVVVKALLACIALAFALLTSWLWLPLLVLTSPVWLIIGFVFYLSWRTLVNAIHALKRILGCFSGAGKRTFRKILTYARCQASDWSEATLGYAIDTPTGFTIRLDPNDDRFRFSLQLYHYVATGLKQFTNLRGLHLIELDCGDGAGLAFVLKCLHPASALGITESEAKAEELRRRFAMEKTLGFHQGISRNLPIKSGSADAVISLQRGYRPSELSPILKEVRRILKPGGHIFYADLHDSEEAETVQNSFESNGFVSYT